LPWNLSIHSYAEWLLVGEKSARASFPSPCTLIIYIDGDNGTSAEGTLEGTFNQLTAYNGILTLPEGVQMPHYEDWGSHYTYPHISVAGSWAFDTPFK
jgi:hypothetical protein